MILVTHLRGAQASFQVRPCRTGELAQLPIVETAADAVFPPGRVPPNDTTPFNELQQAFDCNHLLVSTYHQRIVGFIAGLPQGKSVHLRSLAVHPSSARQGIGTALLRALLHDAEQRGYSEVTLTTFSDLVFNAPFYERLGFRRLAAHELDPRLSAVLEAEQAAGMTQRVAMRRQCTAL